MHYGETGAETLDRTKNRWHGAGSARLCSHARGDVLRARCCLRPALDAAGRRRASGRIRRAWRGGPARSTRDHERRWLPGPRRRRKLVADDDTRAGGDAAAAADAQRAGRIEALGVPGAGLRGNTSRRRDPREHRRPRPAHREGRATSHRRHRRHRLPHEIVGPRLPGVQRCQAVAIRAGRLRSGSGGTRPRDSRRRLSLPREHLSCGQRRLYGQSLGLRLGCVERRPLHAGAAALRGSAMDRRARQSRVLRPRRPGLVALSRSAPPRGGSRLQRPGAR